MSKAMCRKTCLLTFLGALWADNTIMVLVMRQWLVLLAIIVHTAQAFHQTRLMPRGRKAKRDGKRASSAESVTSLASASAESVVNGPQHQTEPDLFWPSVPGKSPNGEVSDHSTDDEENGLSADVLDSIIKIHATHSNPSFTMPWQRKIQTVSTSSGFPVLISDSIGSRIITNAHSVEYGSIIQVQKRGGEEKYQAQVESIGNECDLAVLRVDSKEFWDGVNVMEFGCLPRLQDEVEVLGYPTGGDALSITSGVVSRIEIQEYSQGYMHLLAIQIDAAINAGNSGGPIVDEDGKIIGVAFQGLDDAENIGYAVPVTVLQHFLEDIRRNGSYTGFCALGMRWTKLENKSFRKYLGMAEGQSGVMVSKLDSTAPSSQILKKNDVIMSVDGINVGNDGKIPFRPGERVSLACYLQTKFLGDTLELNVLRDGKETNLVTPVHIGKRLVRTHWNNKPPPYLVMAGLVFTPLSVPLLEVFNAWDEYVTDNVSYLLGLYNDPLEELGDEVVVLAHVLAHTDNLGYEKYEDLHLVKFNEEKVRSLQHLQRLINECQEPFVKLEFSPKSVIVVLEYEKLKDATAEVCKEHGIQQACILYESREIGLAASDTE